MPAQPHLNYIRSKLLKRPFASVINLQFAECSLLTSCSWRFFPCERHTGNKDVKRTSFKLRDMHSLTSSYRQTYRQRTMARDVNQMDDVPNGHRIFSHNQRLRLLFFVVISRVLYPMRKTETYSLWFHIMQKKKEIDAAVQDNDTESTTRHTSALQQGSCIHVHHISVDIEYI